MNEYFKDFVGQMTEAFIHKQLDRLTSDIHRRTIQGVDEESKPLILQCASFLTLSLPPCLLPLHISGTQYQNSVNARVSFRS